MPLVLGSCPGDGRAQEIQMRGLHRQRKLLPPDLAGVRKSAGRRRESRATLSLNSFKQKVLATAYSYRLSRCFRVQRRRHHHQ